MMLPVDWAAFSHSGLHASEGQCYRCPVSHPIFATNQRIQHPAAVVFFIAHRYPRAWKTSTDTQLPQLTEKTEPSMPKNNVTDPITDQEIAFARLVLSGTMSRDQVLARLWEIANLSPEITRGNVAGQVKALSMIIAIEGLIPDRRASPAQNKSAPPPVAAQIYEAAWLRTRQPGENVDPQPPPTHEEAASEPPSAPGCAEGAPPISGHTPGPTPKPNS
jgi:hypothetical protein